MVGACPFPTCQGSQVLIRQLSEALQKRGHEVHVVTYHIGEATDNISLPIHRIPGIIPYRKFRAGPAWRKPFLDILLISKLFQVVKRFGIDIIHAHNYEAVLAGLAVRFFTGVPVLFHTHGVMEDELHTYFQGRLTRYAARKSALLLDSLTSRRANHIIAISPETMSFFQSKEIDCSKIDYIPPGIFFPEPIPEKAKNYVQQINNIGEGPIVLYAGNLDQYQNLNFLIESFVLVLNKVPEAKLVLLTHCETDHYEKLCRDLGISGNVALIGYTDFNQVQFFLKKSDLAVLPRTSWSGFPIKLLNYMAAGKAVVACRGSAKAIEHLKDGIVVKNGDRTGFAEAIIKLINDRALCEMLGKNAKEKVKKLYAWDHVLVEVEKIYEKII